MFIVLLSWQGLARVLKLVHTMCVDSAQAANNPQTKPTDLGL